VNNRINRGFFGELTWHMSAVLCFLPTDSNFSEHRLRVRLHSATNGSFREANLQRQLSGDETGDVSVATRPKPVLRVSPKRTDLQLRDFRISLLQASTKQPFVISGSRP